MAKLIEILKGAGRKFATYELGLDELGLIKESRAEVKELKTRYGLHDNWNLDSYNEWRNKKKVPEKDKNHMEFLLDETLNGVKGLAAKHAISVAEIGLLLYQVLPKISQGDYLGAAGTATIILGIGEFAKAVAHYLHSDECRMYNLLQASKLREEFGNEDAFEFTRYLRHVFSDQTRR